jgi:hypothetical protein
MNSASSLFIGYARTTCTTEQVKTVFNNVLDEDIVTTVDECIKKDPKGYEFKIFFVHFARNNHRLEQMVARISKEGFVPIVYNTEFDKKVGARVERYWKVLPFTPKPAQITGVRIMTEEEAANIARPKHLDAPIVEGVVIAFEDESEATKEEVTA